MPGYLLTRRQFADKFAAALRAEGDTTAYEFDELDNAQTCLGVAPVPLEEHYLETYGQPAHFVDQLALGFAHMFLHPPVQPATWEEAKSRIFPYIRPTSFHAHQTFRSLERGETPKPVPYGAITEHVTVCVGTPTKWKTLVATVEDLACWGVTIEAALDQARDNVSAKGHPGWQHSNDYPGVYRSPWKDEFGISRLLFPDLLRQLPLRGDPVIIAPTWQTFLVAGSDDAQGLANLGIYGKKISEKDGYLIYRPMRVRDGALVHWVPPKGHPGHGPLRFLHLNNECGDYADQARVGKRYFDRREQASNIPIPQVVGLAGGVELATIVTWREGPPCALAKCDYVFFRRKFDDAGVVRWEDMMRVIGSELEPLNIYPPRWLGRRFPADWQISSMGLLPWAPGQGPG